MHNLGTQLGGGGAQRMCRCRLPTSGKNAEIMAMFMTRVDLLTREGVRSSDRRAFHLSLVGIWRENKMWLAFGSFEFI